MLMVLRGEEINPFGEGEILAESYVGPNVHRTPSSGVHKTSSSSIHTSAILLNW